MATLRNSAIISSFYPMDYRRFFDCSNRFQIKWSVKSQDVENDFFFGWELSSEKEKKTAISPISKF